MSELSRYLNEHLGDRVADDIVRAAARSDREIDRSVVYNYLRGKHAKNPREETLLALAAGFGVDVRDLRKLVGRQRGELGPYVPDQRANSLTQDQRDALDRLIVTIVEQGGSDAGQAEAQKTATAMRDRRDRFLRHNEDHPLIRTIEGDLEHAESTGDTEELKRILDRLDALILAEDHGELVRQFQQAQVEQAERDQSGDSSRRAEGASAPVVDLRGNRPLPDNLDQLAADAQDQPPEMERNTDLRRQAGAGEENQD